MATNREGASNPMQKGERRQRLHENQNNVGNPKKDTIEFRTSNGTLNPEVIKKNVYLA